jgi:acyloxyacyl hydrolase
MISKFVIIFVVALLSQVVICKNGAGCFACTTVMYGVQKGLEYFEGPIEKRLFQMCDLLPPPFNGFCKEFVIIEYEPLIHLLEAEQNPDIICREIGMCKGYEQCSLFPNPKKMSRTFNDGTRLGEDWWQKIIEPFIRTFGNHTALFDHDKDSHSEVLGFRGSQWRGKDCNDNDASVYPGRAKAKLDPNIDHNCNGIKGVDPVSGKSYEDVLCGGLNRGIGVIGDSISAHFRIPQQIIDPEFWIGKKVDDILPVLAAEGDWPHISYITGYDKDTTGFTPGPTNSLYKKLRQRNRCIHRDYINLSVNGGRSSSMTRWMNVFYRNQSVDQPMLLIYNLAGNDVCNGHPGFDHMTKPQEFYNNIRMSLAYMDTILPNNSFIVFIGQVQGQKVYEAIEKVIHVSVIILSTSN